MPDHRVAELLTVDSPRLVIESAIAQRLIGRPLNERMAAIPARLAKESQE